MNAPGVRLDPMGDDVLKDEVREVTRLWWLLLLGGVASLVIGVLLLVWTNRTLEVLAILVGINLLLIGAIQVGLALGEPAGSRTGTILRGAFAGIAGLIVIRHPGGSLLVIALAVGIYLVLAGVMKLLSAFAASVGRGWLLLGGVLDLAIGVLIVAWPKFGVTTLAVLLGIVFVVQERSSALPHWRCDRPTRRWRAHDGASLAIGVCRLRRDRRDAFALQPAAAHRQRRVPLTSRVPSKSVVTAALLLSVVALAACGESAQEKAMAQVCSARADISKQVKKLEGLTFSSSTLNEAKAGFEAIGKDLNKIHSEQSALAPARKEQVKTATHAFEQQLAAIAGSLVTSLAAGNIEAELKNAQPQLKAAVSKLAGDYKQALGPISCP